MSGSNTLKSLALALNKLVCSNRVCALKIKTHKRAHDSVVTWWPCPRSPTGEDYAEISTTGSITVVYHITSVLKKLALVQAPRGEFTRRAIANNKLSANNAIELAKTFGISCNAQKLKAIATQICKLIVKLEAQSQLGSNSKFKNHELKSLVASVEQLRATRSALACIAGKTNTGKSSLFNAVTQSKTSIADSSQGTTRDTVRARRHGVLWADTAGFKRVENKMELSAMLASLELTERANTIMALYTINRKAAFFRCKSFCSVIQVVSKSDLIHKLKHARDLIFASAYSLEGITALTQRARRTAKQTPKANVVHNNVLTQAKALISQCASSKNAAFLIKTLTRAKTMLIGALASPIIDRLLSQFCFGK
ncbi:tRNA modification GTPase MnmE [Candidatus Hodgkinia cicadicola]|nr:tRNA modification GTPase MnmE [Candidatus Hodgkinia cicadicola]